MNRRTAIISEWLMPDCFFITEDISGYRSKGSVNAREIFQSKTMSRAGAALWVFGFMVPMCAIYKIESVKLWAELGFSVLGEKHVEED